MSEKFNYSSDFQDLVVACVLKHPDKFIYYTELIKPGYFNGLERIVAMRAIIDYQTDYGRFPALEVFGQLVYDKLVDDDQVDSTEDALGYVNKIKALDTGDVAYVLEKLRAFAVNSACKVALNKVIGMMKEGEEPPNNLPKMFEDALSVGKNLEDKGLFLYQDSDEIVDKVTKVDYGVKTGYPLLDGVWKNGWGPGWLVVPLAPPKRYKCEAPGTKVLMHDGTVKNIEDIKAGDRVMGDDSTPRNVLSTVSGRAPMYKVEQSNGDNYTVTDNHILCVSRLSNTVPKGSRFKTRYAPKSILEITAKEYAHKPQWFQRTWKGYKVGVEFPHKEVPVDPYFMGIWLGDGDSRNSTISTADTEVISYCETYAAKLGLLVSKSKDSRGNCITVRLKRNKTQLNPITEHLRKMSLLHVGSGSSHDTKTKRIHSIYRINSREVRLQLLAGLIDSDGHLAKNRGFIFTNTNENLAEDVCWLARSLGFKSFVRKSATSISDYVKGGVGGASYSGIAYKVYVQGKISCVPTKIKHKRGIDSAKASSRTTLKVTPVGEGDYHGFELDGNRRYLHSDFTVTHNTAFAINLAMNMTSPAIGQPVFYYACEISEELTGFRALTNLTGLSADYAFKNPNKFKAAARKESQDKYSAPLVIKSFTAKTATINDIRSHANMMISQHGIRPKAIFIDYAETVQPSNTTEKTSDWRRQAQIYVEARALGAELGCCVVMPDRCNKETIDKRVPNMASFQGAFEKAGIVDVAIGLCATDEEYSQNIVRYFVCLNRHGKASGHFRGKVQPEIMRMSVDEEIAYEPEAEEDNKKSSKKRTTRRPKADIEEDTPRSLV